MKEVFVILGSEIEGHTNAFNIKQFLEKIIIFFLLTPTELCDVIIVSIYSRQTTAGSLCFQHFARILLPQFLKRFLGVNANKKLEKKWIKSRSLRGKGNLFLILKLLLKLALKNTPSIFTLFLVLCCFFEVKNLHKIKFYWLLYMLPFYLHLI